MNRQYYSTDAIPITVDCVVGFETDKSAGDNFLRPNNDNFNETSFFCSKLISACENFVNISGSRYVREKKNKQKTDRQIKCN